LWDVLDIDRNRINATMSSTEKIDKSYAALSELVKEVCEKPELQEMLDENK
jgi:hypothetical protein